ncbi:MAG: hypothetical protein RBT57_02330 [Paludibacter sp.]|jgi:hypothetical protein|nr:hypothetical protein [Paludibacter sp.]
MKRYLAILLVTAFAAGSTQHSSAQLSVNVRYNYHEFLDLQAVATAFSQSRTISDFEYILNDNRNRISNLDLNNDGYIDYLRIEQYSEYDEHVIEVQAVLGRNYYQTVATLYIWRDRYNNEQIQIVGHESIYGRDYIIEPVFRRRPVIIRWLWDFRSPRYVSPYYWGYYPRHYRVRHIVALPSYHHHIHRYIDTRHHYNRIEHSNRPVRRDNRGNVYRGNESRSNSNNSGYNENNRKHDQRPSVDSRNDRKPEVIQRNERQPETRQRIESRQNDESKREVNRRDTERKPEIKSERVRDARPEPSKSTPAPSRSSESSSRRSTEGKSETSSGRR